jgi:membrane dipeptidase
MTPTKELAMATTPDWRALHEDAVVADTHNDLLMCVTARPVESWGAFFASQWLPQLRAGGVDLQVLPVFIDDPYRPDGALRETLRMIECAHRLAEANDDAVALCLDGTDIEATLDSGRIALVLALESAPGVDADVELLETLFRLGVRVASLAHWGRTPLADGSAEDATRSRLTRAGVRAVALMEQLGMVFDVSHLGATGVEHVLEIATRPVMATHSSAAALRAHHRNLPDEHVKEIAAGGGIVCVNFFAPFLHESDFTLPRLLDHIEHLSGLAGVEHVGLGPDFVKEVIADLTPPCCEGQMTSEAGVPVDAYIEGLEGPAGLPLVTQGLLERGWPESDVRAVLGANVQRFFADELGRPGEVR